MLKQKIFTRIIKNAKLEGLGRENYYSFTRGFGAQALKVRVAESVIKISECFVRVNT